MLKRKKGAIVSLGSGSTLVLPSYPCNALYAGTKDYVAVFSQNLSIEYKEQGIDIQCQAPLLVATRMISNIIDWKSFWVCSSEEYGKASLRWIGYESLCIPNMTHAAQVYLVGLLSEWVCRQCAFHIILRLRNKLLLQEESSRTT
uniref:Uncharacterized protein n=1 Tax=Opuntia streptacantha TaxID=393608 RepID=A0A7C9EP25_OPUST